MSYIFLPTDVFVCFYKETVWWRKIFDQTDIWHCGVMFKRDNYLMVVVTGPRHRAKIVSAKAFHKLIEPASIVHLGEAPVCLNQIKNYLSFPYKGEKRSLFLWWYFTRRCFPNLLPRTCTLLSCTILRLCGFNVKDHIPPRCLYKEITSANDYYCWSGRSWEDYLSEYHSEEIF